MIATRWAIRVASWGVLVASVLLLAVAYVHSNRQTPHAAPTSTLPEFGEVPAFALTAHTGQPIRLEDLQGKVWVTNFFFTTCRSICPVMQENMAEVQKAFAGNPHVRLVSFTVDPEHDTPEVLRAYAQRRGAVPGQWMFVTGDKKAIYRLARQGFKLAADDVPEEIQGTRHDFIHSEKLVLIDTRGHIRGYYSGLDMEQVQRLIEDTHRLLREEGLQ